MDGADQGVWCGVVWMKKVWTTRKDKEEAMDGADQGVWCGLPAVLSPLLFRTAPSGSAGRGCRDGDGGAKGHQEEQRQVQELRIQVLNSNRWNNP